MLFGVGGPEGNGSLVESGPSGCCFLVGFTLAMVSLFRAFLCEGDHLEENVC
jgi:hypothetical protein